MANELSISVSLTYDDGDGYPITLSKSGVQVSVGTAKFIHQKNKAIGVSEEALDLGEVTSPGLAIFINKSALYYIDLKVATSGAIFARLKPGDPPFILRLGGGAQAPYAVAENAAATLEYLLVNS